MEPTLIALGVSLLCASLVPLTTARYGRGAALAYLGAVAWGSGFSATTGSLLVTAVGMTILFCAIAAGLVVARSVGIRVRRIRAAAADE